MGRPTTIFTEHMQFDGKSDERYRLDVRLYAEPVDMTMTLHHKRPPQKGDVAKTLPGGHRQITKADGSTCCVDGDGYEEISHWCAPLGVALPFLERIVAALKAKREIADPREVRR